MSKMYKNTKNFRKCPNRVKDGKASKKIRKEKKKETKNLKRRLRLTKRQKRFRPEASNASVSPVMAVAEKGGLVTAAPMSAVLLMSATNVSTYDSSSGGGLVWAPRRYCIQLRYVQKISRSYPNGLPKTRYHLRAQNCFPPKSIERYVRLHP